MTCGEENYKHNISSSVLSWCAVYRARVFLCNFYCHRNQCLCFFYWTRLPKRCTLGVISVTCLQFNYNVKFYLFFLSFHKDTFIVCTSHGISLSGIKATAPHRRAPRHVVYIFSCFILHCDINSLTQGRCCSSSPTLLLFFLLPLPISSFSSFLYFFPFPSYHHEQILVSAPFHCFTGLFTLHYPQ